MPESSSVVVLTTCKSGQGQTMANALVAEGLAACVNIIPGCTSVFFWDSSVQTATEELLLIKTSKDAYKHVEERVKQLHSYDVPEILSLAIQDIYEPYKDWLLGAVLAK